MEISDVAEALGEGFQGKIERDVPLAPFTTFRIGGPADLLVMPKGREDLTLLLRAVAEAGENLLVLGGGSNVLISDRGFRGVVAVVGKGLSRVKRVGELKVEVEAGCDLNSLIRWSIERGLRGLEPLSGIPGTVGGATSMNAGARGIAIGDIVEEVSLVSVEEGTVEELSVGADDMGFGYRCSRIGERDVIYEVKLKLEDGEREELKKRRREALGWRRRAQPLRKRSAGSVFKNPEGVSAGELIDGCGLKGMSIGEAVVSEVHANFIVNRGKASAEDVRELMLRIKEEVLRSRGVELEEEIILVGEIGDG